MRTAPQPVRRRWSLVVLLTLAGLLGMHALTSDHALPGASRAAVHHDGTVGRGAMPQTVTSRGPHHPAAHAHGVLVSRSVDAARSVPFWSSAASAMAHPWCVAVLTAALLLVLIARRVLAVRRRRGPAATVPPSWARPVLRPPPSPPDPVAGLCISRT